MLLSNFSDLFDVVIDGHFDVLAKCTDNPPSNFLTYLESEKYLSIINTNTVISCVIVKKELLSKILRKDIGIAISDNPKYDFFRIHNMVSENRSKIISFGKHCEIADTAIINSDVIVLGDNVLIEDNVVIKGDTYIGDNTIIRCGAVIGAASFENCRTSSRALYRVREKGIIRIGKNVEIGELTVIDNAVFDWDTTDIGDDSYIGPRCIITHGCKISNNVTIKHGAILCGFVIVKAKSVLGPGCIISNRLTIGEGALVSLGATVTQNVLPHTRVSGNFAISHDAYLEFIKKISNNQ